VKQNGSKNNAQKLQNCEALPQNCEALPLWA
jgi:hypothetical protein